LSEEPIIDVTGLTKVYGDLTAVDHISFSVQAGHVFAFLGPNGAGKTTTIEMLQCLRSPTSGEARVLGFDISKAGDQLEIKRRIGVLPQDFSALDKLTVRENVALFAGMYDNSISPDEVIRLLDLEDKEETRFDELSGGLKQKVGIAAALVNNPELLFLDEPTTGLDPRSRREVWEVIRRLKKKGTTVFLTTHYMDEAQRLADSIGVIHHGRIVAHGSPSELLREHGGVSHVIVEDLEPSQADRVKEALPNARTTNGRISIPVEGMKQITDVIEALGTLGVTSDIQIRSPTIEDVFLTLVGTRLTEEGELA